jgi:hypothetical protein
MSKNKEANMSICKACGEPYNKCLCAELDQFFQENGHLMKAEEGGLRREQVENKFYFVKPSTHRTH